MLDQLIESNSHARENTRRGGFLLTTFVAVAFIFAGGMLWSLYAKDLSGDGENLELASLIAPVPITATEPPKAEPETRAVRQETASTSKVITRVERYESSDTPTKSPDKISSSNQAAAWIPGAQISTHESGGRNSNNAINRDGIVGKGIEYPAISARTEKDDDTEVAPVVKIAPKPVSPPATVKRSGGVLNGQASYLAQPVYPPPARAVHATGAVNVQVTVDERGNVISANAVSGHPLLRQAAETAARQSKFTPTKLSDQPVKVTGLIVYNFNAR